MPSHKKRNVKGTISKPTLLPLARKAISLRSQTVQALDDKNTILTRGKRRGDISPLKNEKIKRSALGNLTNNVVLNRNNQKENFRTKKEKNEVSLSKIKGTHDIFVVDNENKLISSSNGMLLRPTKILTRAAVRHAAVAASSTINSNLSSTVVKIQQHHIHGVEVISTAKTKSEKNTEVTSTKPTTRRISNEFEKTEDSLYMSALEDVSSDSIQHSTNFGFKQRTLQILYTVNQKSPIKQISRTSAMSVHNDDEIDFVEVPSPVKYPPVPEDVNDFDKENMNDPFQVSEYAMDIFEYLKQRETLFPILDYIDKQKHLSKWMRSLLVDWMVEVQETFELNHETLYLAVKLVDLYLGRKVVIKDRLQLLGAGALLIACKYDERTPPLIDDFLYICDGAYNHDELIKMEVDILKAIDFDLGIPLSYRFLRRYARCAKIPMQILTLARYILELSLMDYATICIRDSYMACAVLFMALRMSGLENPWNRTLEYYSGYKLHDFADIVPILNCALHKRPRETIKTIRNKYSHKIFFEVAKIPLISTEQFFEVTKPIN